MAASFELERFAVTPVTDATVLLELGVVLVDVPPRGAPPRLLVEGTRRSRREHDALETELDGDRLRVSFVVPSADVETAGFALAVGGLLLELPAPDPTPGADRTVALARELNGARRELARMRTRIEADAEAVSGHAAELVAVREEAARREQEAIAAADARAASAEEEAGERVAAAREDAVAEVSAARAAADERVASSQERASSLEVTSSELETVLADVRAGAEHRDAAAAADRRELEEELDAAHEQAASARQDASAATLREEEAGASLAALRSELELAQRALDARDAELARSPDRRARAVGRPRTVAGVTGEHAALEPEDAPAATGSEALRPAEPDGRRETAEQHDAGEVLRDEPTEAHAVLPAGPAEPETGGSALDDASEPWAERADPDQAAEAQTHGTGPLAGDDQPTEVAGTTDPVEDTGATTAFEPDFDEADDGDPFPDDDPDPDEGSPVLYEDPDPDPDPDPDTDEGDPVLYEDPDPDGGDPVPDDGESEPTATHDAVPSRRSDPEPPEDTGPIPLRRSSERRYVPRSDRDEELGGDAVRVLGRERPRASALPPPPEADPGPPALPFGLTQRTLAIAVFALAAFLVLVAILGYIL